MTIPTTVFAWSLIFFSSCACVLRGEEQLAAGLTIVECGLYEASGHPVLKLRIAPNANMAGSTVTLSKLDLGIAVFNGSTFTAKDGGVVKGMVFPRDVILDRGPLSEDNLIIAPGKNLDIELMNPYADYKAANLDALYGGRLALNTDTEVFSNGTTKRVNIVGVLVIQRGADQKRGQVPTGGPPPAPR